MYENPQTPKGWPMKGKSGRKAAATEARQEAGVSGRASKRPAGKFRYWKRLSATFVPIEVTVYVLEVEHIEMNWREEHCRSRAWMTPTDAAALIDEPELASLVRSIEIPQD